MLVYKALYKKMMDDLKDAGMWIEWAEQVCKEHPDEAKFLLVSAKERLEESFPKTHEHFKDLCEKAEKQSGICMDEVMQDHMMEWHAAMMTKVEKMLSK